MADYLNYEKECIKMLRNSNQVKLLTKIKQIIKHGKIIKKDIAFWPNALLVYALIEINTKTSLQEVQRMNKKWYKQKYNIANFDDYLMGYLLLKSDKVLTESNRNLLISSLDSYLLTNNYKIFPYRLDSPTKVYIDLLGMLPPYLSYKYALTKDKELLLLAERQYTSFKEYGFDSTIILPYHGYDMKTKYKEGIVGWGRGIGWYLFGLAETISNISSNKEREYFLKLYFETFEVVLKYLKKNGLFSWQIIGIDSYEDTSATALILLSILKLMKEKIYTEDIYDKKIENMIKGLKRNTLNYKVMQCSSECGGFGVYPQNYGCYPWSLGPAVICFIYYQQLKGEKHGK